jgi:hypothetical protein
VVKREQLYTRRNPDEHYGGIAGEPVEPHQMWSAWADFRAQVLRPFTRGRDTLYYLVAATFPAAKAKQCTGQQSFPASGTYEVVCLLPNRVTSIELWNYDAAQSFTVTTQTSEGGIIGGNLYMAANSYYAWDVNLRPTDLRIELSGTASSKFQVAINGL